MNCQQIFAQYEILRANKELFRMVQKAGFKKERATALACKETIESALKMLDELLGAKITIKNAENPFAEVYEANGLPRPEKEIKRFDLEIQMNEDIAAYRTCGLARWADDIETARGRLKHLNKEKKRIIAQELADGAIPIFMPGRDVLFSLTVEDLTQKLKPYWRKANKEMTVADSSLTWEHFIDLINKKAEELTKHILYKPYILLTKPTQSPEERTKNKSVDAQKKELVKINDERKREGKASQYDMKPHEYEALQKFFTERAKAENHAGFSEISPLDSGTWTRFITLPVSSGCVPDGYWDPVGRRLRFGGSNTAGGDLRSGFRLSVAVEI